MITRRGFLGSLLALPAAAVLVPKVAPVAESRWLTVGATGATRLQHITIHDAATGKILARYVFPHTMVLADGDTFAVNISDLGQFSV